MSQSTLKQRPPDLLGRMHPLPSWWFHTEGSGETALRTSLSGSLPLPFWRKTWVFSHPGANQAQPFLAPEVRGHQPCSGWFGCRRTLSISGGCCWTHRAGVFHSPQAMIWMVQVPWHGQTAGSWQHPGGHQGAGERMPHREWGWSKPLGHVSEATSPSDYH